ncbi:MAG: hypothetical protein GXX82_13900 [Syntrophorhabdus sp.]|nr:hypothetical protein [Syntrophorhabdus sp.]
MELWVGALNLGFLYAFVAIGIYITFRIHDFPDITVDGTFTTGAAISSVLVVSGVHPLLAVLASFLACSAAGSITALINTRLNVNSLLAGILVMTGLYSVNLHIMGRSNIPLLDTPEFFTLLNKANPGLPREPWTALCLTLIMAASWFAVSFFFKTDFGLSMRATGNNPTMARAAGINVDHVKIFGVAIANGLVGISGSLVAQYQGFADIGMGIGTVVTGLASVIIGESILKKHSVYTWIASAIIGSVIFRFMIATALYAGMDPIDLKLMTAIFVLITLVVTAKIGKGKAKMKKKHLVTAAVAAAVILGVFASVKYGDLVAVMPQKKVRIGVFQVSNNPILDITRDSFLGEMKRLGYVEGKNATFIVENASGELATLNAIADKFLREKVDIVVPISTACTQVAANKIKDRPVVFATVANPFLIGAGKSDTDHLPNMTGVYGAVPMDRTMDIVTRILPGKIKIGVIWDPSQANSEYNVNNLKKAVQNHPNVTFVGGNIANSSEVYQVAASLVQKGIDAFVLSTDNTVYTAFDSVVKAARGRKVPIIFNDVDHPEGGALVVFGYAYESSGRQAANLVDRIIKGEKPASIPFERYKETVLGINLKVARELGITIPRELIDAATVIVDEGGNTQKRGGDPSSRGISGQGKRLALFQFTDNVILDTCAKGVIDGLKKSGVLEREKISVDHKMANGDFPTAQSIAQEMVSKKYDYIVTVSTISLQVTVNHNKEIPHIFAAVTDPIKAGAAKSFTDHPPNLTGIATPQPVEATVKLMRRVFPKAKVIGMIWNPAEANSEICTLLTREAAKKYGFKVVEVQITGTQEIDQALRSILASEPDIFFTSGDTTVSAVIPSVAQKLRQKKIPYVTNTPADIDSGVFMCLGADYYDVGLKAAELTVRVIGGEKPAAIPIVSYVPEQLTLSLSLAKEYGISIPDDLVKKAVRAVK